MPGPGSQSRIWRSYSPEALPAIVKAGGVGATGWSVALYVPGPGVLKRRLDGNCIIIMTAPPRA